MGTDPKRVRFQRHHIPGGAVVFNSRLEKKEKRKEMKLFSRTPLLIAALSVLAACAAAPGAQPTAAPATDSAATAETAEQPEVLHIRVGVSPVPHGDILRFINENLAPAAGLEIEIVEFTDYVQPNLALDSGDLDANYFQHVPYLEDFNAGNGLELISVAAVHIEPLGIYSSHLSSLEELADGAVVTIPNDATNAGRALNLLAANGLLTLKEGVGYAATLADITENPKGLDIRELEAAQLVRSLEDTAIAVINGNYALEAGLVPAEDALALESGENNPYANILAVNAGHADDPAVVLLIQLLTSPEVKQFILEHYNGSVIPAF